ncbi:MAG TPA: molybdopterin converting factor subunit 1 [Sutterella sp.]|nr:molybdopterin converting factor subunit 1 [Sutterella sp.]
MKLTVKYFALLREAVGVSEEAFDVPQTSLTVSDLMKCAGERHPEAFASLKRIRAAVNESMVPMSAALKDGDVVAFFPPVTGG